MQCVDTIHIIIKYLKDVGDLVNLLSVSQLTNCVCREYLNVYKKIKEQSVDSDMCLRCSKSISYHPKITTSIFFNIIRNRSHKINVIKHLWYKRLTQLLDNHSLCFHVVLETIASLSNPVMIDLIMLYMTKDNNRICYHRFIPLQFRCVYIYEMLKNNNYITQSNHFQQVFTNIAKNIINVRQSIVAEGDYISINIDPRAWFVNHMYHMYGMLDTIPQEFINAVVARIKEILDIIHYQGFWKDITVMTIINISRFPILITMNGMAGSDPFPNLVYPLYLALTNISKRITIKSNILGL